MADMRYLCTCSAAFLSEDDRDAHVRERQAESSSNRHLAQRLIQSLEQKLQHSGADEDGFPLERDIAASDDDSSNALGNISRESSHPLSKHKNQDGYHCPYADCKRRPVEKMTGLRNHFGTHIDFERPCPICSPFKSKTLSEWVRHVTRHQVINEVDTRYIQEMCHELSKRVDEELMLAGPKYSAQDRNARKRIQEAAQTDFDQRRSRKARIAYHSTASSSQQIHEKDQSQSPSSHDIQSLATGQRPNDLDPLLIPFIYSVMNYPYHPL
ncbi:hypothetical protein F4808DRAFT_70567 [Astrocystis sublimbata]|nr:hypothetical protein F4808DRAFT_70567 [Astrocystis sublimbata]